MHHSTPVIRSGPLERIVSASVKQLRQELRPQRDPQAEVELQTVGIRAEVRYRPKLSIHRPPTTQKKCSRASPSKFSQHSSGLGLAGGTLSDELTTFLGMGLV